MSKKQIARAKLPKQKETKEVTEHSETLQKMRWDIATISPEKQLKRCANCMKSYVFRELWIYEYRSLAELMQTLNRLKQYIAVASGLFQYFELPRKHI